MCVAMSMTVTLNLPDSLYQRLVSAANATHRPLEEVLMRAIRAGSPPAWDDVPEEVRADLAALDQWDDAALYQLVRQQWSATNVARYDELLERKADGISGTDEQAELERLRDEHDRWVLRKAHATALLRWRGRMMPPP